MHNTADDLRTTKNMLWDMRVVPQPDGYHHIRVSREEMQSLLSDSVVQLVCRGICREGEIEMLGLKVISD